MNTASLSRLMVFACTVKICHLGRTLLGKLITDDAFIFRN